MKFCLTAISFISTFCCYSQLLVDTGATITIAKDSKIYAAGNVTSSGTISGRGVVVMNGSSLQTLSMNGNSIQNLHIDNIYNVQLGSGETKIDSNLHFIKGKLKLANQNLVLANSASITTTDATNFVWTNGTGLLKKTIFSDFSNYLLPLGDSNNYRPAFLTTAGGNYNNAFVGVQFKTGINPNTPPMILNWLNGYWPVTKSGISGGTVTLKGQYNTSDIVGVEGSLAGYYFDGNNWNSSGETHNVNQNQISVPVSQNNGVLFAMNKFVAIGARALLQGAYDASTGLMSDALRSGSNIIPLSDPYRSATYAPFFTHVNNTVTETASSNVFLNNPISANNIVDWVYLELRNVAVSPGNTILQTRSALIQRDGDIVDIDGISPVTFNNLTPGNYILAIRHRNHLGISLDPATGQQYFDEKITTAFNNNIADFRTTSTNLYGPATAYSSSTHPILGSVKMLWAGNASINNNTRYTGIKNDKDAILINALGNNATSVINNIYSPADINMNRVIRFNGLQNDKDYLYINILGSNTTGQRVQSLPN